MFLYLLDEKTSLLVQVPAGVAAVIEVSSCYGAVNVCPVYPHSQAFARSCGGPRNMAMHVCVVFFGLRTVLETREGL